MGQFDRSSRATLVNQRPGGLEGALANGHAGDWEPPMWHRLSPFAASTAAHRRFPALIHRQCCEPSTTPWDVSLSASSDRNSGTATGTLLGPGRSDLAGCHRDAPSLTTPRPRLSQRPRARRLKIDEGRDEMCFGQPRDET